MNYKLFFLCIIIVISNFNGFGQSLFPFGKNKATWTFWFDLGMNTSIDFHQYTLFYSGKDSLINNKSYAVVLEGRGEIKMDKINTIYFFREENKKLFLYDEKEGEDVLIYDFSNLNIGDNLKEKGFLGASSIDFVTAIDTIELSDGTKRKRYTIFEGYSYLIEGVGSTLELLPFIYHPAEYTAGLICHQVDEKEIYLSEGGECFLVTATKDNLINQLDIAIFPNPVKESSSIIIKIPSSYQNNSPIIGKVYSISGEEIKQFILTNKESIRLNNIAPGFYLIRLNTKESPYSFFTKKLVVLKD